MAKNSTNRQELYRNARNSSKEFKQKIKCLNFYKSEICKYPHSRSLKAVEALARFRGISSGNKYAEAFYLNRYIKD